MSQNVLHSYILSIFQTYQPGTKSSKNHIQQKFMIEFGSEIKTISIIVNQVTCFSSFNKCKEINAPISVWVNHPRTRHIYATQNLGWASLYLIQKIKKTQTASWDQTKWNYFADRQAINTRWSLESSGKFWKVLLPPTDSEVCREHGQEYLIA